MNATDAKTSEKKKVGIDDVPQLAPGLEFPKASQDPVVSLPSGRHFSVSQETLDLLQAVDGRRNIKELGEHLQHLWQKEVDAEDLRCVFEQNLWKQDLVWFEQPPQATKPKSPLWLELPLIPSSWVHAIAAPLTSLYHRSAAITCLLLIGIVHLWFYSGYLWSQRPGIPGQILDLELWLTVSVLMYAIVFCHEFGHAAAVRVWGEKPGHIGFGMYLFIPVFYTDVQRAWRLPKRGRIQVDLGGTYFELLATALLLLLWHFTRFDPLAWAAMLMHVGIWGNFDPLLRMDGYWLLTDISGVKNLREVATQTLIQTWRERRMPTGKLPRFILGYAAVSTVFFVIVGIWAAIWLLPKTLREFVDSWEIFRASWSASDSSWLDIANASGPVVLGSLVFLGILISPFILLFRWALKRKQNLEAQA